MRKKSESREAATDIQRMIAAAHAAATVCRPFGAVGFFDPHNLGLTPQAKDLSRLRRWMGSRLLTTRSENMLSFLGVGRASREAATYS